MSVKKIIAAIFCLGAIAIGSTAGSFLENSISARSMALGNVSLIHNEGSASYRNPAIIKLQSGQSYQAMQGQVLGEVNYFAFDYTLNRIPLMDLGLSFSFLNSGVDGIQETTYDSTGTAAYTGDSFSYAGRAYIFGLGMEALDNIFLGANLKMIQEVLHDQTSNGFGLDLGVAWKKDKITLGASIINAVPPNLTWSEGWEEPLDTKIILSLAYNILQSWTVYSDLEKTGERPLYFGLGTEYVLFDMVSMRGGWNPDALSLGTGVKLGSFGVDYAYLMNSDQNVGSTHFISIAYLINDNADADKAAKEALERKKLQDAIEAEKQRQELQNAVSENVTTNEVIEEIVTASAEIHPLPVEEQVLMETVTIDATDTANAVLDPVETVMTTVQTTTVVTLNAQGEEEIIQEIIEDVSVNIIEESPEAVSEYRITMMTARYYYQTHQLQSNIYLDNIGNQPLAVTSNFRLLDSNNQALTENQTVSAIAPQQTAVLRIPYAAEMPTGNYYLELTSESDKLSKYQKELYIKYN